METFVVTQLWPEGVGLKRRVDGLWMTGPEVAATLADTTTCEDIIHEDDHCGLSAAACWHLRPYLPKSVIEEYDAEHTPVATLWRHPEGLVWFRAPDTTN